MSGHRDVLGVVKCERTRTILAAALNQGWQWIGYTKTGHVEIVWPATGQALHTGTTPSGNSWKAFARNIEAASGVKVWHKGNRRASRKNALLTDPREEARRRNQLAAVQRGRMDREAQRQGEAARQLSIRIEEARDRRDADMRSLMNPSHGH